MKTRTATFTALCLALGASTYAQPGSLDADFGAGGYVTTSFGVYEDAARASAIQGDGKIVAAGYANIGSNQEFALARYNVDGSLDLDFDVDGKVTTIIGTSAIINAVAIQSDGKIVGAGIAGLYPGTDVALARYNADGSLDTSFGLNGTVITDFPTYHTAESVVLQPDGKIVVAGHARIDNVYVSLVLRYNVDGSLDSGFGLNGKVTTAAGISSFADAVILQPDGKIVVAGGARVGITNNFALVRYQSDGSLDTSFGVDGIVLTGLGLINHELHALTQQPDGKFVATGHVNDLGGYNQLAVSRYNLDGSLDNSFGVDGIVLTNFGTNMTSAGSSVVIQSDGKILAVGETYNAITLSGFRVALARYETDGTLDAGFGVAGLVASDPDGLRGVLSILLQQDGKIVVTGSNSSNLNGDFGIARYLNNLSVGIVNFSLTNSAPLIYPNPIAEHATLEYTLQEEETLTVQLLDMQGKILLTFLDGQDEAAGEHQQGIELPASLPAGPYLLVLSSPNGKATVQVVK